MLKVLLTLGFLQLLTMLALFVRTKLLALMLGPEQVGVLAVVDKLLAVFSQSISLSLPYAAVRFLPEVWTRDRRAFADLFRRMRNVLLLLSVLAAAAGVVVTAAFPAVWTHQLLPYRQVVVSGFLCLPVLAMAPFLTNAIAGRLEQNRSMVFAFVHAVVLALTAVLGILWKGLVGFYVLYGAVGLVLVTVVSRRVAQVPGPTADNTKGPPPPAEPARFPLGLPVRIWRFALILFGLTFVTPYAAWYVHSSVLRDFGAETAGWMQGAIGISLAMRALLGSANAVFLTPNVNRGGSAEDRMHWTNDFHKTLCLLMGVVVPPLLLFPHLAVRVLYSRAFLPGAGYVALFVITETLTLLSGTYQALVVALDHLGFYVAQNIVAQLLIIGIAAAFVPSLGIAGAGLASLSAPLFMLVATVLFLGRRHSLRLPPTNGMLTMFLVAGMAGTGYIGATLSGYGWPTLLTKVAAYVLLLGALVRFLTPAERTRLGALVTGLRRLRSAG